MYIVLNFRLRAIDGDDIVVVIDVYERFMLELLILATIVVRSWPDDHFYSLGHINNDFII